MKTNPFDIYTYEYEEWFNKNKNIFQSELLAIKKIMPVGKIGVEIGIGSGIFAEKLGVQFGVDPSENMLALAKKRNLLVKKGGAENLPYLDNSFDFALFITSMCFVEDPQKSLQEAYRIIKNNCEIIIAFIDKKSILGQNILSEKEKSKFYSNANLYSVPEMIELIEKNNFQVNKIIQTLENITNAKIEKPIAGYGKGSFVIIKGTKKT